MLNQWTRLLSIWRREISKQKPLSFEIVTPNDTPEEILSVLTYEVGDMHKCLHRMKRYPQSEKVYMAELKVTTSDAQTMLHAFMQLMKWKVIDIENLGRERVQERLKDMRDKGVY